MTRATATPRTPSSGSSSGPPWRRPPIRVSRSTSPSPASTAAGRGGPIRWTSGYQRSRPRSTGGTDAGAEPGPLRPPERAGRAVDPSDHGAQRCVHDRLADADAPEHPVADRDLQIGGGLGVPPGGQCMLGVVEHADCAAAPPAHNAHAVASPRGAERGSRAVAGAGQDVLLAEGADRRGDLLPALLADRA